MLNATVFYGDEHNREGRGDLGRGIGGASVDLTVSPSPFWALNAGVAFAQSDYDAPIPLLDVTRRDRNLGVEPRCGLPDQRQAERARANTGTRATRRIIELYEYTRHLGVLKVRYEFK